MLGPCSEARDPQINNQISKEGNIYSTNILQKPVAHKVHLVDVEVLAPLLQHGDILRLGFNVIPTDDVHNSCK